MVIQNDASELPGDASGYTVPGVGDWDGDGDLDLLVGTFVDGPVYLFENTADEGVPVLEGRGRLRADGEIISGTYG